MLEKSDGGEQSSRKKHHLSNAFFSALAWFMPLVLGFVATRIIVEKLGYEEYGLFSLIIGFISYSFAFGIGRAVTKYVSEYQAQNKTAEIEQVISVTFWFSLILGVAACSIIVPFADLIVTDVLQINESHHENAVKGLYLASATIGFLMIGQVFQSVLQALYRFDRNSLLVNINGILVTCGNILLVSAGFRLVWLLVWNLAAAIINSLLFYREAKKLLPHLRINLQISRPIAGLVFRYGLGVIGYQIFGNILLVFERSWITRNLGTENLTFYVVPMSLAIYLHGLVSSLVLIVLPTFSELRDDRERLLILYLKATKIIFAIVAFLAVNLICASRIFLKIWMGDDFADKSSVFLIVHVLTFALIAALSVVWQMAEGLGHPRYNAFISFIWLIVAAPLMIATVSEFQNLGIALSRLAGVLVTIPFLFYAEKLFFGSVQWSFWLKLLLIVAAASAATALVEWQIYSRLEHSVPTLLLGGAAGTIVYVLVLWKAKLFAIKEIIAAYRRENKV